MHPIARTRLARANAFVLAGLVAASVTGVCAPGALAVTAPIQISGTAGEGVYIRPTPDTSQPAVGWMPEGASPDFNCWAQGQLVGYVDVWFNVTYNGVTGYYASYYDNSSYQQDSDITAKYGIPQCGAPGSPTPVASGNPAPSAPPTQTTPSTPTTPSTSPAPASPAPASPAPASTPSAPGVTFNRGATVAWAEANATKKPPDSSACTWFVSNALWAGGLPQTAAWTSAGSHGLIPLVTKRPGSVDAWAAPNFINYILATYPGSTYTQLNLHVNNVPAAQPGDVIAYAWNGGASVTNTSAIKHLALVVGDSQTNSQYPEVAEWGVDDDGIFPGAVNYTQRGWTWSQISGTWLQTKYPKMQAFLLHINTAG